VSEGGFASKALGWGVVIGGVVIVAGVVALYSPSLCLFDLRDITVSGTREVPPDRIRHLAGLRVGDNILRLDLSAARDRIASDPWIRRVDVHRLLPHTVSISIVEHRAVGFLRAVDDETWITVSESGLGVVRAVSPPSGLLEIRGVRWPGLHADELRVLEALAANAIGPPLFAAVEFSEANGVRLYGVDAPAVSLGPANEAWSRIDTLAALLDAIMPNDYQTIDLTLSGEAVLVPR